MRSSTKNEPTIFPPEPSAVLRYAQASDVENIQKLLVPYADQGILLYKNREKIEHDLPHTLVYATENKLLGVANLYPYDSQLYEVRGLAIDPNYVSLGIGKMLIQKLLEDLKKNKPEITLTIFALTIVPDFFLKLGWKKVPKENFPRKIFDDCSFCVRRADCFEDAVEIII